MKKILASLSIAAALVVAAPAMAQSVIPTYPYYTGYTTGYTTSPSYYYSGNPTYVSPAQPQAYCPSLTAYLYIGSSDYYTGGQVSALQQFLAARGYYQPVTGYYGSITAGNVANFQQQQGVYPVTGGVGPLTRAAIARACGGGYYPPAQGPVITSITPTAGPVGTVVAIQGSGFTNSNTVRFGNGGSMQVPSFYNGTLIYYTVPSTVSGCDIVQTFAVCAQYVQLVTPGTYQLSVSNQYGQSQAQAFTVTGSQSGCTTYPYNCSVGGVTVSSPSQGQTYSRGQSMTITWGYPVAPNSTQMMLELYTASGSRVGLIAVSGNTSGSYAWNIPGYPQNYMCTLQYPNGLCGTNIPPGQYYVKVSASNDPLDSNPNIIASGQSGIFYIAQ